ncbi:MAG: dihydroorotase family protein [Candidatus Diapherotrites archaeon]
MKLVLKNGQVFSGGELKNLNIGIDNGKIAELSEGEISGSEEIDCTGKVILPGLIDPHVHFRTPGLEHKEDWATGSRAALHGGVTTVLDMPNTNPPTLSVELLEEKRKIVGKDSLVNFGFHFGAAVDNIGEIKKVTNVASVKVFMNLSTGRMLISDRGKLGEIFGAAKQIAVHAEGSKVRLAMDLAKETGTKLYLCHISTAEELEMIADEDVSVEATPHHLFLTEKDAVSPFFKMIPGLKSQKDQDKLWEAINSGRVNSIGTDHAPHTAEEKESEDPPAGVPGIETMLPLLLDSVNGGRLELGKIVELCCENPARIFGIKNKGFIEEGFDADLAVVDLEKEWVVKGKELFTKCKWSPFDGKRLKGFVERTIVGGIVKFENGKIVSEERGEEIDFE